MAFRYRLEGCERPRITISEATGRGVEPAFLSEALAGYKGKAYLVRSLLGPTERRRHASRMIRYEFEDSGERVRYDYWSILAMLFRPRVPLGGGFLFCSEAIQQSAIEEALISSSTNKGMAVVPGELWKLWIYENKAFRIY